MPDLITHHNQTPQEWETGAQNILQMTASMDTMFKNSIASAMSGLLRISPTQITPRVIDAMTYAAMIALLDPNFPNQIKQHYNDILEEIENDF